MTGHVHGMRRYIWMVLSGALVLAGPLQGLCEEQALVITLGEAIRIAQENSTQLKRVSNQVVAGRLSIQQARADFYPTLSASASVSGGYARHLDSATGRTEGAGSRAFSTRASSSVGLFEGFGRSASLRKSRLELAADESTRVRTRQSLVFDTIAGFLQVLQDREILSSAQQQLEAQRRQLERIEGFFEAGNRPMADVLQQRAATAQQELQVLTAQRNLDVAALSLLTTMGLDPSASVRIAELPTGQLERLASDPVTGDSAALLRSALGQRADAQAQNLRLQAATQQLRVARSGYWPTLSLSADGGSGYSSQDASGFSDQFLDTRPNASIGLSASIPLFDRSRTKYNVALARVQVADEQLALTDLEHGVAFQVRQAMLDLETAAKQLDTAQKQLQFAREALQAAEDRYGLGASTLVELAQSRAQYAEAANERIRTHYGLLLHRVAVAYYRGDMDRIVALFD